MAAGTLTIDLDALARNWRALDAASGPEVTTAAVVKAGGYGLGVAQVATRLAAEGVRTFFVATAGEGAELRHAIGPAAEICAFSGHMAGDTDAIANHALTPMLNSVEQLIRHFEALPGHPFGVQIDSGMNRLGMEPAEWEAVRAPAMEARPTLLMSHLACADEPDHPMNAAQLKVFREVTDGLGVRRSLAATGGILLGPEYHFDLTRPGVGLYGGAPFADAAPVVHLALPVIQVRDLAAGEVVGYGATYTAETPRRIATLAAGYADGILRTMSGKAQVFAGDTACPLAGRVSMDLLTVDVSHLDEVPEALDLLSHAQGVDAVADAAGTIGYEILTSLGPRYQRHYIGAAA